MVVRELLDPPHVLDEPLCRGRRDESLDLPLLSNRVDEVESAAEDREETQERLPYDVVAHRTMDRLEPVRALGRDQVLRERKNHRKNPQAEDEGAQLIAEFPEQAHGGRGL